MMKVGMTPTVDPFCGRAPEQINEYVVAGRQNEMTPSQYVAAEEGTFNPENGHFCCTECYVRIGMPTAPNGWKCP